MLPARTRPTSVRALHRASYSSVRARDTSLADAEVTPTPRAMSGRLRPTAGRDFVLAHEIRRREHENLAHHVRILLVSAHEPDHPSTSRVLDHSFKTVAHQLLKRHPRSDHRRPAPT